MHWPSGIEKIVLTGMLHKVKTSGASLLGLLFYLFVIIQFSFAQYKQEFLISETASSIKFAALHMGFLEVEGSFTDFEGEIRLPANKTDLQKIKGNLKILVESIHTENTQRDRSLVSDSFFHTDVYPIITVILESVTENKDGFQA